MTPNELLDSARSHPEHSQERALFLVAAIQEILGKELVLVGGAAVNTYTADYGPTDIDLIGPDIGPEDRAKLTAYGFVDLGLGHRHLSMRLAEDEAQILVEFPKPPLEAEETTEVRVAPGTTIQIISLEDLVLDRLRQATDDTGVTHDAAVSLVTASYDMIDWVRVERLVAQEAPALSQLPEVYASVKRAAEKALRQSRRGSAES